MVEGCYPHPGEIIHEKNNQSPSSLQILSFRKRQQPAFVLLVLQRPSCWQKPSLATVQRMGQARWQSPLLDSGLYRGRIPRLTLTHMDREAVLTPAQAQVQDLPSTTSSGPHPKEGTVVSSAGPYANLGTFPHSSGPVRISFTFPSPELSRLSSLKPLAFQAFDKDRSKRSPKSLSLEMDLTMQPLY